MNCPCCGGEIKSTVQMDALRHVPAAPRERALMDILVQSYPRHMSISQLADRLYADDMDGGPVTANRCVSQLLFRIRARLKPLGWTAYGMGQVKGVRLEQITTG